MGNKPTVVELDEKKSDNWSSFIGVLVAVALVIIAVAVWQIASALSIGCVAVSGGIAIREACRGIGYLILTRGHARAEVARALGETKAQQIAARTGAPLVIDQPRHYLDGRE